MAEQSDKPSIVEMAKKQRHIYLYEKLHNKKPLSRAELKELSKYEEKSGNPGQVDTIEQVAKVFNVSLRTVGYWAKDGMPVRSDGKYDIKDIQSWRFQHRKNNDGRSLVKKNLDHWDARYREFKARKEEILYRKHIGELVERSKIENGLILISTAIKRELLGIPRSLAPVLAGLEPREIEKKLTDRIKETIDLFAKDKIFLGGDKENKHVKARKKTRNLDRKGKASLGAAG